MQYLITYIECGETRCFFTKWFDVENHFNTEVDMIVYDLYKGKYFDKDLVWKYIEEDHL